MSKKKTATYCLVVDADVVRAAGTLEATSDRSIRCREALHAIRSVCHRIAWSAEIQAEWEKHAAFSEFGSTWLVSMFQLDNKVRPVKPPGSDL
jgi:hypothetical protein